MYVYVFIGIHMAKVLKDWLKSGCSLHVFTQSATHIRKENLRYISINNIEYLTFVQLRAFTQLKADINLIITMNLRHIDGFLLTLYEQENSTSSTRPLHTMKKNNIISMVHWVYQTLF